MVMKYKVYKNNNKDFFVYLFMVSAYLEHK